MPCYVTKTKPPSREEYQQWQKVGYIGTYEQYQNSCKKSAGETVFVCGNLGDHCADCNGFGDYLCDYPVGNGKTCDRIICDDHGREVAPEIHYCNAHYQMWTEFKNSGGVDEALKNVVAFKNEKGKT